MKKLFVLIVGILFLVFLSHTAFSDMTWTKSWSASDDGSPFGGADVGNIQSDVGTYAAILSKTSNAFTSDADTENSLAVTASSLTTGSLAYLYSNSSSTGTRSLVNVVNDNSAATGTKCLTIDQDANAQSINIDYPANTTASTVYIDHTSTTEGTTLYLGNNNALTSGSIIDAYSDSSDVTARNLVRIWNDNSASTGAIPLYIQQDSNNNALKITTSGTTADTVLITGNSLGNNGSLVYISSNSADTNARNLVWIINDHADADAAIPLHIQQDGAGAQIVGHSNENLSNSGVWTDRTSTFADKEGVINIIPAGFLDKIKNLKLYNYQKKCEIYGNKQDILSEIDIVEVVEKTDKDGKKIDNELRKKIDGNEYKLDGKKYKKVIGKEYPSTKKHPNAKTYTGFILDDPTTPEELISRDVNGNIDGISASLGVNFLLAVNKELVAKVESLEARIEAFENK